MKTRPSGTWKRSTARFSSSKLTKVSGSFLLDCEIMTCLLSIASYSPGEFQLQFGKRVVFGSRFIFPRSHGWVDCGYGSGDSKHLWPLGLSSPSLCKVFKPFLCTLQFAATIRAIKHSLTLLWFGMKATYKIRRIQALAS